MSDDPTKNAQENISGTAAAKSSPQRIGDYVVKRPLGRGSFSKVVLGVHFLTGREVCDLQLH